MFAIYFCIDTPRLVHSVREEALTGELQNVVRKAVGMRIRREEEKSGEGLVAC